MSNIGHYEVTGPASAARARAAGLLDLLAAAILSMLVVPQPIVRASLMGGGASPASVALFVAVLLVAILVVFFIYLAFCAVTWGRTPVMYLLDLGLNTPSKPTTAEALLWAAGWTCASGPAMVGIKTAYDPDTGWPSRWSGAPTCSTAQA